MVKGDDSDGMATGDHPSVEFVVMAKTGMATDNGEGGGEGGEGKVDCSDDGDGWEGGGCFHPVHVLCAWPT